VNPGESVAPLIPDEDLPAGAWQAIDQPGQVMSEGSILQSS
jgi:hypothetical protein